MAKAQVQLNFRVDAEMYQKLEAAAAATGESKTEIVRKALAAYLEKIKNA
jgi:predicted DNA-binding protein